MQLSPNQVTQLLNKYLKAIGISDSPDHPQVFSTIQGGHTLMKRLYLILKDDRYSHLVHGTSIDVQQLLKVGRELLKGDKKVYIVGLNHWFSTRDIDILEELYREYFI